MATRARAEGASEGPGLLLGRGVRATEAQLLAELERDLAQTRSDPSRLRAPLRIVVPSQSLRLHLCERIAAHCGAVVGLQLQSLAGLASEIADAAGEPGPDAAAWPLQVRREARREPVLARELDAFHDAYGPVLAGVDDLLDAGFEPALGAALLERIDALPIGQDAAERAQALVRVAMRLGDALGGGELGHRSRLFATARAWVERAPALVAARSVIVYGFSDATGVQADLIEALVRYAGARVWLDVPIDPTDAAAQPISGEFGAGFRQRVMGAAPEGVALPGEVARGALRLLAAPDRSAEVRTVAERLRRRLDAGVPPERTAVVARDLAPYRWLLRAQLHRLGVPFSGIGEPGAATRTRRRLDALSALVAAAGDTSSDRWLEALERIPLADGGRAPLVATQRADLRDALHTLGAVRLEAVALLAEAAPEEGVVLGARRGLRPPADDKPARASRRRVRREALAAIGRNASALLRRFESRPTTASLDTHGRWLEGVASELGWRASSPGRSELAAALRSLGSAEKLEMDREEFDLLLERALAGAGISPLGGAGGGVQVLSVMEARARSFDHLFVLGMSRGTFPRSVREDALLPDALRARLREVLPDLPVKREGFDEERFLFAQLVSAAGELTFSHPERDDDGRPLPRSPLLESLVRCDPSLVWESVPPLRAQERSVPEILEPPADRALRLALHGHAGFEPAFRAALSASAAQAAAGLAPDAFVRARLAVLHEQNRLRNDAGPYFGFVGAAQLPADLRHGAIFVTTLENLSKCPWQAFLGKLLRLSPRVDASGTLPGAGDARLLGITVHEALDRIVGAAGGELDDALLTGPARRPVWPDPEALDGILLAAAEESLREAAIGVPGFARVLARRARPYLERVRDLDWADGPPHVLAAEVMATARVNVGGTERKVRFKADRLDRVGETLRFTDYKTGKPLAKQSGATYRDAALQHGIASGRLLQALAYARRGGPGSEGRYLQLHENAPDVARAVAVRDEPPYSELFDAASGVLFDAWDAGGFFPRLRQAESDVEPGSCRFCDVKQACLRGDSGARRRLGRWADDETGGSRAVETARALYRLGVVDG